MNAPYIVIQHCIGCKALVLIVPPSRFNAELLAMTPTLINLFGPLSLLQCKSQAVKEVLCSMCRNTVKR